MVKDQVTMHRYGLIGKNISYSFSKGYFTEKFLKLGLNNHVYSNFDLVNIEEFSSLIIKDLKGLNVTIPYKEKIMPFLDTIDQEAKEIGAVNTIKILNSKLIGYNTDVYGFEHAIKPKLNKHHKKAMIFGTGGASKAIGFALDKLGIAFLKVSRTPKANEISYKALDKNLMSEHQLLINCTPLGTFPKVEQRPDIPYGHISSSHFLFDLIYNPEKSEFLKRGERQGAQIQNGYKMLELQAERSWEIWNM